jgi:hypothetical protein
VKGQRVEIEVLTIEDNGEGKKTYIGTIVNRATKRELKVPVRARDEEHARAKVEYAAGDAWSIKEIASIIPTE